ncbi:hypothetical protein [Devriesea agamarum]|uniref:hypothetical protein n=1 Tax=Devriesea agamarum TaxID=472569 RepID=UPI00071DF3A4|nr:hypothetical protein [Devriesea agamarum]
MGAAIIFAIFSFILALAVMAFVAVPHLNSPQAQERRRLKRQQQLQVSRTRRTKLTAGDTPPASDATPPNGRSPEAT